MSTIFISHSSQDNEIARDIERRLASQGHHSVFLDIDPEKGIVGGQSWERTLYRKLRACRAMIALCTDHYLDSHWCFAEIALARMEGKHIIVLKADPLGEQRKMPAILTERQFIDLRKEGDEGYRRMWHALEKLEIIKGIEPPNPKESPYLGLSAYQEKHASLFFGREEESLAGIELLDRGAPGLIMVLGASGSGKSSLVRAGLLPRLRFRKDDWLIVDPFRPGRNPMTELTESLVQSYRRYAPEHAAEAGNRERIRDRLHAGLPAPSDNAPLAIDESDKSEQMQDTTDHERLRRLMDMLERLHEDPPSLLAGRLRDYLEWSLGDLRRICGEQDAVVRSPEFISNYTTPLIEIAHDLRRVSRRGGARVLLVVDQFEELLGNKKTDEDTGRFLALLRASIEADHSPLMVLGTMRSDFLGFFQRNVALRGIDFESLSLGPMKIEGMRRVIEEPAKLAAIELEGGLADRLLEDTETSDALPLLSFTLWVLWRNHHYDQKLKIADYEKLDGLQGAITVEADAVLKFARHHRREDALRKALLQMARLSEDGSYARRPVERDNAEIQRVEPILEKLIERRVLVSRMDGERRIIEVAHEALFRAWKPLRAWLDHARSELLLNQQIERDAKTWQENGRAADNLWRGGRLLQARELVGKQNLRGAAAKGSLMVEFVRASLRRRLRLQATVAVTTFAVIAFLGGSLWYALGQRNIAEERAITAEATLRWSPFDLKSGLSEGEVEGLLMLARDDKAVKRVFAKHLKDDAALASRFSKQPKAIARALAGLDTDARAWLIQEFLITPMPADPAVRKALGFLSAELEAAEGFHLLVAAIQDSTNHNQLEELEGVLKALASKLTPAQAKSAADKLVAGMQNSTKSSQLKALGEALEALVPKLTPAQAKPFVGRLVAAMQNSTDIFNLIRLQQALEALASKLTPAQAKSAADKLVAGMQNSTKSSQLKALGEALAALPIELTPVQAEPAVGRLVAAMQESTNLRDTQEVGQALIALAPKLIPAAKPTVDRLIAAMQNKTNNNKLSYLGGALVALASKLPPAQAEPAVGRLVAAMQDSNNYDQLGTLGRVLAALPVELTPVQAEPAVDKLIAAMQDSTDTYQLRKLGRVLAALPVELTPVQAEPTLGRLVAFIQDENGINQLEALGEALAALASKWPPAQTESAVGSLVAAMQDSTNSSQLKALKGVLAALAAKLTPSQAESAIDRIVAATKDRKDSSQLKALGGVLAALAAKLTPSQAEPAVDRIVAAIKDSANSYQVQALGRALAALPFELSPSQAEPAIDRLVTAMQDSNNPIHLGELGKVLAALPVELTLAQTEPAVGKLVAVIRKSHSYHREKLKGIPEALASRLPPAQAELAADRLVAAMKESTNSYGFWWAGKVLSALASELLPVQAGSAVDKLIVAMQDSTNYDQLETMGKLLAALPVELTLVQAEPVVSMLVAAMQDSNNYDQLEAMGKALAALPVELTLVQAEPAVGRLVAAMQGSTEYSQLKALGEVLAALAAKLTPSQAEPAVDRIVAATKDSANSYQVEALGGALAALPFELSPSQAEPAIDRLVAAIKESLSSAKIHRLGDVLSTLLSKLPPAQAESAVNRLVDAIQSTSHYQLKEIEETLAALATRLPPAQAELAGYRLVAAMQDSNNYNQLIALGRVLAALPVKLTPSRAEPAIDRLIAAIQNSTKSYQASALGKILAALPVELNPAQVESAVDKLVDAMQDSTDSTQLGLMGEALAALELPSAQAGPVVDTLVAGMQNSTKTSQLKTLGEVLAALPVDLPPAQAEPAISRLIYAIQNSSDSHQLGAMEKALAALLSKLPEDEVFTDLVFEKLKFPNIRQALGIGGSESVEDILLVATRKRFKYKGVPGKDKGFWKMVKWAKEEFPYLDLKSPPKEQVREKVATKQG